MTENLTRRTSAKPKKVCQTLFTENLQMRKKSIKSISDSQAENQIFVENVTSV